MITRRSCVSRWSVQETNGSRDSAQQCGPSRNSPARPRTEDCGTPTVTTVPWHAGHLGVPSRHGGIECKVCITKLGPGTGIGSSLQLSPERKGDCTPLPAQTKERTQISFWMLPPEEGAHATCRLCSRFPRQAGGPACPLDGRKTRMEGVPGSTQGT